MATQIQLLLASHPAQRRSLKVKPLLSPFLWNTLRTRTLTALISLSKSGKKSLASASARLKVLNITLSSANGGLPTAMLSSSRRTRVPLRELVLKRNESGTVSELGRVVV